MGALCQGEGVVRMALRPQRERLETLQEEERAEGVESGAEVAQDFDADLDCERHGAEGLAELEAVVTFGRFGEVREPTRLRPVKLACTRRWSIRVCEESIEQVVPESMTTPAIVVP